jgi:hypothetical protein
VAGTTSSSQTHRLPTRIAALKAIREEDVWEIAPTLADENEALAKHPATLAGDAVSLAHPDYQIDVVYAW